MDKLRVICPCCEAALTIDGQTGALLAHEEKKKAHGSFEDLAGELSKQKELREQLFAGNVFDEGPRTIAGREVSRSS